jgi:hypothetical protein
MYTADVGQGFGFGPQSSRLVSRNCYIVPRSRILLRRHEDYRIRVLSFMCLAFACILCAAITHDLGPFMVYCAGALAR